MMLCDPTNLLNSTTTIFVDTKIPLLLWSFVQVYISASRSGQFKIYVHDVYSSLTSVILLRALTIHIQFSWLEIDQNVFQPNC